MSPDAWRFIGVAVTFLGLGLTALAGVVYTQREARLEREQRRAWDLEDRAAREAEGVAREDFESLQASVISLSRRVEELTTGASLKTLAGGR